MTAHITGFGSAVPGGGFGQGAMWDGFYARHSGGGRARERVFRGAGVEHRHVAVNPLVEDASGWTTGQRMRRYAIDALPLGKEAVAAALADAGIAAEDVGLFAVVSCTGYGTPGVDIRVAADLGMAPDVQRLVIGHMGCYAALPGLGAVSDYVVARGRPAVLLCLELTSLHVQPPTGDMGQVVSHALFGDAAAAVVLEPAPAAGTGVVDVVALTDPGTADHMTWEVTDHGFRMDLSPQVPAVLAKYVAPLVTDLLHRHDLAVSDVDAWAVHPGGPRILDTVEQHLELPPDALGASRRVLAERGNCSSATVLLVLEQLRAAARPGPGRPGVMMAFGPGLTLYAALLAGDPPHGAVAAWRPGSPGTSSDMTSLTALALNCTLTPSPADSSTQLMADQVLAALDKHGVAGSSVRLVDLDVRPGVEKDMGDGDAWPAVREQVLAADILVLATPTWMGHMSSVASRVMERLDAELSELDDEGRPLTFGKVALVAVVGNEDGGHKITADLFQGLNDVGFTVPAQGGVYWNGEAMTTTDFQDLDETPETVSSTIATMTANAVHLATFLRTAAYPPA